MTQHYVLCANRSWSLTAFLDARPKLPGNWSICVSSEDLGEMVNRTLPRYVFFPHWSFIVPDDLLKAHECVCFHMTDVPYGRGGSPLQNLITRGHNATVLTALRMTAELDAGPVYFKRPLSLEGNAEEIFYRMSHLCTQMIAEIVETEPKPEPQSGKPVLFKRRKPEQSTLPMDGDPETLFNHIRMLDAPGYPHAFLRYGDWVGTLKDAELSGNEVFATVRFTKSKIKSES